MDEQKAPEVMDEYEGDIYTPDSGGRKKWAEFVESTVVDFFSGHKLEKLSLEDGNGNKAKLTRTKDDDVKLEYSTTKII